MINPTGGDIRNDPKGQGRFNAPRGTRLHDGVDYLCLPGQEIKAPFAGKITRSLTVYSGDNRWVGCEIVNADINAKLFYMKVNQRLIGRHVNAGQVIGFAQDISDKYGPEMKPHVHFEIIRINPELFMRL